MLFRKLWVWNNTEQVYEPLKSMIQSEKEIILWIKTTFIVLYRIHYFYMTYNVFFVFL